LRVCRIVTVARFTRTRARTPAVASCYPAGCPVYSRTRLPHPGSRILVRSAPALRGCLVPLFCGFCTMPHSAFGLRLPHANSCTTHAHYGLRVRRFWMRTRWHLRCRWVGALPVYCVYRSARVYRFALPHFWIHHAPHTYSPNYTAGLRTLYVYAHAFATSSRVPFGSRFWLRLHITHALRCLFTCCSRTHVVTPATHCSRVHGYRTYVSGAWCSSYPMFTIFHCTRCYPHVHHTLRLRAYVHRLICTRYRYRLHVYLTRFNSAHTHLVPPHTRSHDYTAVCSSLFGSQLFHADYARFTARCTHAHCYAPFYFRQLFYRAYGLRLPRHTPHLPAGFGYRSFSSLRLGAVTRLRLHSCHAFTLLRFARTSLTSTTRFYPFD